MLRVLAAIAFIVFSAAASAERRVALVIGDDDYRTIRKLGNAVDDARSIEAMLEKLGFDVTLETDRDLRRMRRALDDFREDGKGADVALVFFAGHGAEISGDNRLLPVDADAASAETLKATTLPLDEVREAVAAVSSVGLIILDACRNDPFAAATADGSGRGAVSIAADNEVTPGLGRVGKAENILFAFSAAPGETAADGSDGHSPFAAALVKYLGTDGLEIRSALTLVQQEVYDLSRGKQLPYVESGLPRLFFAATTRDQLPERERLLLAMADVTPDIRAEVEQIASERDMPLAPLYGALIGTDAARLDDAERRQKLGEAADAFVKVRQEMQTLASADPEVARLRGNAEQQLALGAFDTARNELAEAAEIDSSSRDKLKANYVERTLSEAATRYISGGAAKADLRYDLAIADLEKAAALYGEAGESIPPEHADRRLLTLAALGELYTTVGDIAAAERSPRDVARLCREAGRRRPFRSQHQARSGDRPWQARHGKGGAWRPFRRTRGFSDGTFHPREADEQRRAQSEMAERSCHRAGRHRRRSADARRPHRSHRRIQGKPRREAGACRCRAARCRTPTRPDRGL